MLKQSLNLQRKFVFVIGMIFTFLNFLAFLISRNNNFVQNPGRAWTYASATEFRDYPASEFERTLSCYGYGQCQRIGGALIVQPIIYLGDLLSKFYFWNVDDQARIFMIQMVSFGWRIACVGVIAYLIFLVCSNNLGFTLFFLNALLFALSGWLLRLVGEVVDIVPLGLSAEFKARSILAFQDFPHENLQWYDFGLFAALAIIALLVVKLSQFQTSLINLVLIGILITSFFEYLGFVLAISWILYEKNANSSKLLSKNSWRIGICIGFGSAFWLVLVGTYRKVAQIIYPKFFDAQTFSGTDQIKATFWAIQNPVENLTSNPSIPFQIILVISQSIFFGILLGSVANVYLKPSKLDRQLVSAFGSIAAATSFVMIINFFVAYGVEIQAGEHSRQTLGLQIALFTYLFLRTAAGKKTEKDPVAISKFIL